MSEDDEKDVVQRLRNRIAIINDEVRRLEAERKALADAIDIVGGAAIQQRRVVEKFPAHD